MLKIKPDPETGIFQISGTLGGRRIRASAKTRDRTAAKNAAKAIEREYWKSRADGRKEVVLFEDAVASYEASGGDGRFTGRVALHFAGTPIRDIMAGHIQDAARALYPTAKPATWNRQVIVPARAVINHAAERGWCAPIRVSRFAEKKPERVAADREWLDAFMACADPTIAALALFMFTTGARISDALSLTWPNVKERRALIQTKTGEREAVLSREMVLRLAALPRHNSRVFFYKSRSSVYNLWYGICDRAGIERIPPHQAGRHAFATEMIVRQGINAKTAAKLGGWASPRILMENYTHPEALESVVDDVFETPRPKMKETK